MSAIEPGTYKLINVKGGTALDLSGGDNRTIIGYNDHGGSNQQWVISDPDGDENQTIYSQATNLYLAIEDAPENFTRVIASSSPTKWAIRRDGTVPDTWRVFFPGTAFNFDLSDNGNSTPGTVIHLWQCWEGENQLWRFERVDQMRLLSEMVMITRILLQLGMSRSRSRVADVLGFPRSLDEAATRPFTPRPLFCINTHACGGVVAAPEAQQRAAVVDRVIYFGLRPVATFQLELPPLLAINHLRLNKTEKFMSMSFNYGRATYQPLPQDAMDVHSVALSPSKEQQQGSCCQSHAHGHGHEHEKGESPCGSQHNGCHARRRKRLMHFAFISAVALLLLTILGSFMWYSCGGWEGMMGLATDGAGFALGKRQQSSGSGSSSSDDQGVFVKNKLYLIVVIVGLFLCLILGIMLAAWCCKGSFQNPLCCPCYLCACCGGLVCLECISCGLCAEGVDQIGFN